MVVHTYTIDELNAKLEATFGKLLDDRFSRILTLQPVKEFLTEPESRDFLGGISRSLFNKLKKQNKFNTYHCGEGRCLYSREELIGYIKTNKPTSK